MIACTVVTAALLSVALAVLSAKDGYRYLNVLRIIKAKSVDNEDYIRKRTEVVKLLKIYFIVSITGFILNLIALVCFLCFESYLDIDKLTAIMRWASWGYFLLITLIMLVKFFLILNKKQVRQKHNQED